jgi:hypothetical protein
MRHLLPYCSEIYVKIEHLNLVSDLAYHDDVNLVLDVPLPR